jgi:putative acetyltransferase
MSMNISQATSAEEIAAIRELFEEYAGSLGIDLSYQGFPKELADLPGAYAPPLGRLLLATDEGISAGCVALRPVDNQTCEMKRLFVRPERQGVGAGRMLAARVITEARSIGYLTILLDTLPSMKSALRLYESLGFVRRRPYFQTPIEGNVFMELRLADAETPPERA